MRSTRPEERAMELAAATWWKRWWADDYSWEGLAKQRWHGWRVLADGTIVKRDASNEGQGREATLQDYWRDEARNLTASPASGKQFTSVHLPLVWEDGTPTKKARWADDRLREIINRKLSASDIGTFSPGYKKVVGADLRAQFQGAVFLVYAAEELAHRDRVSATFEGAAFLGGAYLQECKFACPGRFSGCAFFSQAHFAFAEFQQDARFDEVSFFGDASFGYATVRETAVFDRAAFSKRAEFEGAAFGGYASFIGASFLSGAEIERATFCKEVIFFDARVLGSFSMGHAAFGEGLSMERAIFAGDMRISGGADLADDVPQMDGRWRASHDEVRNRVRPIARRSVGVFSAEDAIFLGDAHFSNRDMPEPSSFRRARFDGVASFHGSKLNPGVSFHQASFEAALDPDVCVSLSDEHLRALFAARHRGELRHPVDHEDMERTFASWANRFNASRAKRAANFQKHGVASEAAEVPSFPPSVVQRKHDERFAEVEDAFRTLKQAMEANRNRSEEARFFKLEIRARCRRRDAAVPSWERAIAYLYGKTSDYGNSIRRPAAWLGGLILFAGLLYALMGALPVRLPTGEDILHGLSFSMSRAFPFGPWPEPKGVVASLLDTNRVGVGAWIAFGTGVLATLQSLLSVVLFFLAALAARRRFQIS